jgi:PiT family inorganic phosphate transporter
MGLPISTTHVISSSIMGVGATRRFSAVRWRVAGNIVTAWILTIPAAAAVAALMWWLLRRSAAEAVFDRWLQSSSTG